MSADDDRPTHCADCGAELGWRDGQVRPLTTTNIPDGVWRSWCSACTHAREDRYRAALAARVRGGGR